MRINEWMSFIDERSSMVAAAGRGRRGNSSGVGNRGYRLSAKAKQKEIHPKTERSEVIWISAEPSHRSSWPSFPACAERCL